MTSASSRLEYTKPAIGTVPVVECQTIYKPRYLGWDDRNVVISNIDILYLSFTKGYELNIYPYKHILKANDIHNHELRISYCIIDNEYTILFFCMA